MRVVTVLVKPTPAPLFRFQRMLTVHKCAGGFRAAGQRKCACGDKLIMRVCQQGPHRSLTGPAPTGQRRAAGASCGAMAARTWRRPTSASSGHGDGGTGHDGAGGALVAVSPVFSRGPSKLERLHKRGRVMAVTQDMTAEGAATPFAASRVQESFTWRLQHPSHGCRRPVGGNNPPAGGAKVSGHPLAALRCAGVVGVAFASRLRGRRDIGQP